MGKRCFFRCVNFCHVYLNGRARKEIRANLLIKAYYFQSGPHFYLGHRPDHLVQIYFYKISSFTKFRHVKFRHVQNLKSDQTRLTLSCPRLNSGQARSGVIFRFNFEKKC
jgi:hypothetical protein